MGLTREPTGACGHRLPTAPRIVNALHVAIIARSPQTLQHAQLATLLIFYNVLFKRAAFTTRLFRSIFTSIFASYFS